MKVYLAMCLKLDHQLTNGHMLPLKWADGQIGAMPVFDNEKDARKYAGTKYQVYVMEAEPNKNKRSRK